ncbi:MAG: NAD-dependent epimerase/dehydratase family protein [Candidatus Cyclobacteriaceae bacterium M2_1C_046]
MSSSDLTGVKVLVTGATGFIGYRLAEILAKKEKALVIGTGRKLEKAEKLKEFGVELVSPDLTNQSELREVLNGVKYVFHCAGVVQGDAKSGELINVKATEEIVKAAAEKGVKRIIHISTVGAYDMENIPVVEESTPLTLNHSSTYPRTKARGEKAAFEQGKKYNIEVVVLRPSMVYGPGAGVWTTMMYQNVSKGNPVFLGDGSYGFNPVYLDDVVDAIIKSATAPGVAGEAFNISAEATTWIKFMSYYGTLCGKEAKGIPLFIAKIMATANKIPGIKTPIDKGFIEMATSKKLFPTDKAQQLLNWKPTTSLDEGMKQTKNWLKEHNY